jgi:hypothetical protein
MSIPANEVVWIEMFTRVKIIVCCPLWETFVLVVGVEEQ